MKKVLPVFSYLFHPQFITLYGVLIFFIFGAPYVSYPEVYLLIIQASILTVFLPISLFYLLLSLRKVDSIMVGDVKQRKTPLLIHAVLLLILMKKSVNIDFYPELYYFFLASLISVMIAFLLIYLKIKASLHMTGIIGLTVFAIGLSIHFQVRLVYLVSFLLLCNGLVASSRLIMKAHTCRELLVGILIGAIPQIAACFFWV